METQEQNQKPILLTSDRLIHFMTPGHLDLEAAVIFGVSAKETDDAIGYFGTGLKYAVAILLRHNHDVEVRKFTNGDVVSLQAFNTVDLEHRGKEFEQVYLDDRPLGFTTHLGINWELWQAYRELYANTKDERGWIAQSTAFPIARGEGDMTIITVRGDAFYRTHSERGKFILDGETPEHTFSDVEFYSGESNYVFYRGFAASPLLEDSLFRYNIVRDMDLTEDRTIAHDYLIPYTDRDWETPVEYIITFS